MGLDTTRPYRDFEERVYRHRADLLRLLKTLAADGKKVIGYGASTKGNVVLQFCGVTRNEVAAHRRSQSRQVWCIYARHAHPDHFRSRGA